MRRKNIDRAAQSIADKAMARGMTTTQYCGIVQAGNMSLKDAHRIVDEAIRRSKWQSFAEGGLRMLN